MRINSFIYTVAALGLSMGMLASCDTDKTVEYQAAPAGNVQPQYFESQPTQAYSLGETDNEVYFNVYRASVNDPATVNFEWSGDTQMFSLPSSVTFGEEDLIAQAAISVVPQNLDPSTTYTLTVTIPEYASTDYSQNYIDFTFRYFPMSEWEPFGYDPAQERDGMGYYYFSQYYSGYEYVLVETRHSLINEDQVEYRFQWLIDNNNPSLGWETFLSANSDDGGATIYVPEQPFAEHSTYGTVYVSSLDQYDTSMPVDSYFDDVTGTFYLDLIFYVDAGYFGYGYETCVLNGYMDMNEYSVELTNVGPLTIGTENYQVINMSWSSTVALVGYTSVATSSLMGEDGEISDELIEDLVANIDSGKVAATATQEQGLYSFSFNESGNYTVVAVGYKADNSGNLEYKCYNYVSFDYDNGDPNSGWTSIGYVEYTDGYWCSAYIGIEPLTYYVEVQESDDYEGYMRLVDPYGAAYPYNEEGDWNASVHSYLYFDLYVPDCVYIDYSPQTMDWGDGNLTCYSMATYYLSQGADYDDVIAEGVNGVYANDKVTFPFNSLLFGIGEDGWYPGNYVIDQDVYMETGQLEYVLGADGEPLAPFCIDFSTLTDDPLADATRSVFSMPTRKLAMNSSNFVNAPMKKTAKVVKFKSQKLNNGRHTPYRDTVTPGRVKVSK